MGMIIPIVSLFLLLLSVTSDQEVCKQDAIEKEVWRMKPILRMVSDHLRKSTSRSQLELMSNCTKYYGNLTLKLNEDVKSFDEDIRPKDISNLHNLQLVCGTMYADLEKFPKIRNLPFFSKMNKISTNLYTTISVQCLGESLFRFLRNHIKRTEALERNSKRLEESLRYQRKTTEELREKVQRLEKLQTTQNKTLEAVQERVKKLEKSQTNHEYILKDLQSKILKEVQINQNMTLQELQRNQGNIKLHLERNSKRSLVMQRKQNEKLEELQRNQYMTLEKLKRNQQNIIEELRRNQNMTLEELRRNQNSRLEELQREQNRIMEDLQRNQKLTLKEFENEQHARLEKIEGNQDKLEENQETMLGSLTWLPPVFITILVIALFAVILFCFRSRSRNRLYNRLRNRFTKRSIERNGRNPALPSAPDRSLTDDGSPHSRRSLVDPGYGNPAAASTVQPTRSSVEESVRHSNPDNAGIEPSPPAGDVSETSSPVDAPVSPEGDEDGSLQVQKPILDDKSGKKGEVVNIPMADMDNQPTTNDGCVQRGNGAPAANPEISDPNDVSSPEDSEREPLMNQGGVVAPVAITGKYEEEPDVGGSPDQRFGSDSEATVRNGPSELPQTQGQSSKGEEMEDNQPLHSVDQSGDALETTRNRATKDPSGELTSFLDGKDAAPGQTSL